MALFKQNIVTSKTAPKYRLSWSP